MKKLDRLYAFLCKPNPKAFPDENEASLAFTKNKFILTISLLLIFIQICTFPFRNIGSDTNILRFLCHLLMLGFFLIFCRSYPLITQTMTALIFNALSLKAGHLHPDGAYSGLIVAYGVPSFVFYLTQNIRLTGLTSIIQVCALQFSFKKNLIETISFMYPEAFAEKFTVGFISKLIPLQILYLYIVYNLNKKTAELSKANRKAEAALEQQKIFLYSFSHEMRNPMNSLLGNLDLALMSKQIAPEIREMVSTSKVCGVLLLNLINTVLDAGKLGLGKLEVNPTPTRVYDLFQQAWAISHDIITRKGLKSHLKISRQVPTQLLLDSHRLNQVLMNLIGNAIKFTESGSIMLGISWLTDSEVSEDCFKPTPYDDEDEGLFEKEYNLYAIKRGNSKISTSKSLILSGCTKEFSFKGVSQPAVESKGILKIILKDTGCGMSSEELSKLFQKFSQVGHVTSKRQMGTGLGLFLSKEILENMGGEIRAYSKPKIGSTFIICIPTTALPVNPQPEQEMDVRDEIIPKLKLRKLKTIVADDSSFNVNLVCEFYSRIGVEVVGTASNGKIAYEKYIDLIKEKVKIDVMTLDIDMPVMNGKEACEKIRKYEKENNLKRAFIILISGNYEEKDVFDLLGGGKGSHADCFLKKPLVFEELCLALYKHNSGGFGERN